MSLLHRGSDAVHWYMSELSSRVVAQSGVASDRHHLGKLILRGLRDAPDFVLQIDGATGKSETFKSVLKRSIRCATSLAKFGVKTGDNIVLMAPNHLDLTIPFYASLYLGIGIAALDTYLGVLELEKTLKINQAKVVFCQNERVPFVKEALTNISMDATVVTFDDSPDCMTFHDFLDKYGEDADVQNFRAADFDPAETIAMLLSTSGTTGLPKAASLTHKNFAHSIPCIWWLSFTKFPTPTRLVLICSPLQWLSAGYHYLFSPILRFTRLQTSSPVTEDHFVDLVNKYRPSYMIISPTMMTTFTKPENVAKCNFTCFEYMILAGSVVPMDLLQHIRFQCLLSMDSPTCRDPASQSPRSRRCRRAALPLGSTTAKQPCLWPPRRAALPPAAAPGRTAAGRWAALPQWCLSTYEMILGKDPVHNDC